MESSNNSVLGEPIPQLFRYGLIGVVTNLALYFFYLLITYLGVEPKMAMTISYIFGMFVGFVGHRKWTFAHQGALLGSGARFLIAHLFGYLTNFLILLIFVDRLGYPHRWVQAAAIVVVAAFLFITFRYFVFPNTKTRRGDNQ